MTEEPKKPKRGRPSTKKVSTMPICGIVSDPSNLKTAECPELVYAMELKYNNPTLLTKVFKLFKQYKCEIVRFIFDMEYVYIYSYDHIKQNIIFVKIDCRLMNLYYITERLEMNLDANIIFQIMKSVDTNHSYITFSTTIDGYNSRLSITLVDNITGEEISDNVEVNTLTEQTNIDNIFDIIDCEDEYSLSFVFPHKKFKSYVNKWDTLAFDKTIRFVKRPEGNLTAMCSRHDGRGDHSIVYTNDDYIKLKDNRGELFDIGIKLDFIKPYATSLIGDNVSISMQKNNPLILTSAIDIDKSPRIIVKLISALNMVQNNIN